MKATGIVRKVDELGRIVLPKDIRRSLNLKVGTPMEIYINGNSLILKEYSQLQNFKTQSDIFVECLSKNLECDTVITDLSNVIASYGKVKKIADNIGISSALEDIMNQRKTVIHNKPKNALNLIQTDLSNYIAFLISPIIVNGDCLGSIICLSSNKEFTPTDVKCVNILNCLLAKKCDL